MLCPLFVFRRYLLCQVLVVILATLATYLFQWEDSPYNVKILGNIPSGLPPPSIPSFPTVSYRLAYTLETHRGGFPLQCGPVLITPMI